MDETIIILVVGVAAVLLLQSQASQGTSSLASLMTSLLKSSGSSSGKSGGGSSGGGSGGGVGGAAGATDGSFNLGTYLQNLQNEGASDGTPGITPSSDYGYIDNVPAPTPVIIDMSSQIDAALAADAAANAADNGGGGGGGGGGSEDNGYDYYDDPGNGDDYSE